MKKKKFEPKSDNFYSQFGSWVLKKNSFLLILKVFCTPMHKQKTFFAKYSSTGSLRAACSRRDNFWCILTTAMCQPWTHPKTFGCIGDSSTDILGKGLLSWWITLRHQVMNIAIYLQAFCTLWQLFYLDLRISHYRWQFSTLKKKQLNQNNEKNHLKSRFSKK